MLTGHAIRQIFLQYFERHGHKIVKSSPLLPANDPTLLFTNAGMNQFKDVFIGAETREYKRATTSQKCIRAGGKHNDLDEVGKTARHHTFFEMLGNFSFGDYFKEDAIKFAWELLVNELKIDPVRLWFSVFEGDAEVPADEEAVELWVKAGAPRDRVLKFGRKDNFWQMGETGPCGPCSEIHYYMGEHPEDPAFNKAEFVNGPGDDTIEIWNLVFMQYNRSETAPGQYKLDLLPAPSVDTGMGLERTAAVLQGVKTNYDTDLIKPIIEFTAKLAGKEYKAETQEGFAMRVVADHARSTAFAIADGILPGNEGRNYVLRKIMRRAIYNGRENLGFKGEFFYQVCEFVIGFMKEAYPELEAQRSHILKMVRLEEQRFGTTLSVGLRRFEEELDEMMHPKDPFIKQFIETGSLEQASAASEKYQFEWEKKFNECDWTGFLKLIMDHKVPLYLVKSVIERQPEKYLSGNRLALLLKERAERQSFSFERFLAFDLLNYINQQGTDEDKKFLGNFINDVFGNVVPVNYFGEVILSQEEAEKFIKSLDIYFSKQESSELLGFKDFARNYDTYGTPRDLIRLKLEKIGYPIQEDEFNETFDVALQELQKSGAATKIESKTKSKPVYVALSEQVGQSEFKGYETTTVKNAKVLALIKDDEAANSLQAGQEGEVVLQQTPFYSESGGQVGDVGVLANEHLNAMVENTFSPVHGLIVHKVKVFAGNLSVGDQVQAQVDVEKRDSTRRNHTATHLMHAALREVLGTHVKQAGSIVAPDYLRFDFSHYQPLTSSEIEEIENLVNFHILRNETVQTDVLAIEDAMRSGAMALFGEKYGEKVRVLTVNGAEGIFSKELCGGTHVRATGDIGSFKIISDEAIASGTRRIRAVTGKGAFERFQNTEHLLAEAAGKLNAVPAKLPSEIERLQTQLREQQREIERLKLKLAQGGGGSEDQVTEIQTESGALKVLVRKVEDLGKDGRRQLADSLSRKIAPGVVVIGDVVEGKASLLVMVSNDALGRVQAGKIIKALPGARGGGKPDLAEGGVELEQLDAVLQAVVKAVEATMI